MVVHRREEEAPQAHGPASAVAVAVSRPATPGSTVRGRTRTRTRRPVDLDARAAAGTLAERRACGGARVAVLQRGDGARLGRAGGPGRGRAGREDLRAGERDEDEQRQDRDGLDRRLADVGARGHDRCSGNPADDRIVARRPPRTSAGTSMRTVTAAPEVAVVTRRPRSSAGGRVAAGGGRGVVAHGGGARRRASGAGRQPRGLPREDGLPAPEREEREQRQQRDELDRRLTVVAARGARPAAGGCGRAGHARSVTVAGCRDGPGSSRSCGGSAPPYAYSRQWRQTR